MKDQVKKAFDEFHIIETQVRNIYYYQTDLQIGRAIHRRNDYVISGICEELSESL